MARLPFALGLALVGAALGGVGTAAAATSAATAAVGLQLRDSNGKGQRNKRGKGAARRHGAKLRSNRRHVARRTRAKHRKAARRG